jgi:hypothetical protein
MHVMGLGKKPEPLVRTSDLATKDEARVHAGA